MENVQAGATCRHALGFEFMSDSPDNTPIALKAFCKKCRQEWVFDASVKNDLLPANHEAAARESALREHMMRTQTDLKAALAPYYTAKGYDTTESLLPIVRELAVLHGGGRDAADVAALREDADALAAALEQLTYHAAYHRTTTCTPCLDVRIALANHAALGAGDK